MNNLWSGNWSHHWRCWPATMRPLYRNLCLDNRSFVVENLDLAALAHARFECLYVAAGDDHKIAGMHILPCHPIKIVGSERRELIAIGIPIIAFEAMEYERCHASGDLLRRFEPQRKTADHVVLYHLQFFF